jgi:hypothetical protein
MAIYQGTFSSPVASTISAKLFKTEADRNANNFYDKEDLPVYKVTLTSSRIAAVITEVITKDLYSYLVAHPTATMSNAGMGYRQYDFADPVPIPYVTLSTGSTFQVTEAFYDWIIANC